VPLLQRVKSPMARPGRKDRRKPSGSLGPADLPAEQDTGGPLEQQRNSCPCITPWLHAIDLTLPGSAGCHRASSRLEVAGEEGMRRSLA
jgi:hypothetical protein